MMFEHSSFPSTHPLRNLKNASSSSRPWSLSTDCNVTLLAGGEINRAETALRSRNDFIVVKLSPRPTGAVAVEGAAAVFSSLAQPRRSAA